MIKLASLILFLLALDVEAIARIDEVTGTPKADGQVAYIEKHKVEYSGDGKFLRAEKSYETPTEIPVAMLKSDFTTRVSAPDHTVKDFRSGDNEGLRRENGNIIIFDKVKNKPEKTRVLNEKYADNRILVGCQGLTYYLLGHLDGSDPIRSLPFRFLIPEKRDYYDFDMKEITQPGKSIAEFEIIMKSWFLRIFAPKLHAKYDRKAKRLIWYQGLSNIKNGKGENQNVTTEYKYGEYKHVDGEKPNAN